MRAGPGASSSGERARTFLRQLGNARQIGTYQLLAVRLRLSVLSLRRLTERELARCRPIRAQRVTTERVVDAGHSCLVRHHSGVMTAGSICLETAWNTGGAERRKLAEAQLRKKLARRLQATRRVIVRVHRIGVRQLAQWEAQEVGLRLGHGGASDEQVALT